jgi:Putative transposase
MHDSYAVTSTKSSDAATRSDSGENKIMTVPSDEFLRRFLIHVLPKGLVRIRDLGLFANRRHAASLQRRRSLLGTQACADRAATAASQHPCPMMVVERLTAQDLRYALIPIGPPTHVLDSS